MIEMPEPQLPILLVEKAVKEALMEDLGRSGDITSNAIIPPDAMAGCILSIRENGILCGMELANAAFVALDPSIEFKALRKDCRELDAGDVIARIEGNARSILAAERVALNFLMRMSGIASHTRKFVNEIASTKTRICCTRKTAPGHRVFDKYAVKCGGGSNHRFGLDDAILIKDNHIAVSRSLALAVERARQYAGHLVSIEVEVDTYQQFLEALMAGPDAILLDNMSVEQLADAVVENHKHGGGIKLEASGNVSLETVRIIAETGVDYISSSKLTMAAPAIDLGLDIKPDFP